MNRLVWTCQPLASSKNSGVATPAAFRVTLSGDFNEASEFEALVHELKGKRAVVDLRGVRHINSTGVRGWVQFVAMMNGNGGALELERCSVAFVAQINMIAGFARGCRVVSFAANFVCPDCGAVEVAYLPATAESLAVLQQTRPCDCGGAREFDDLVDGYAAWLGQAA
jgi:anti-anti-sigma regulatory factor